MVPLDSFKKPAKCEMRICRVHYILIKDVMFSSVAVLYHLEPVVNSFDVALSIKIVTLFLVTLRPSILISNFITYRQCLRIILLISNIQLTIVKWNGVDGVARTSIFTGDLSLMSIYPEFH